MYFDTSALLKIYKNEDQTEVVREFVSRQKKALILTPLQELEFTNAIRLNKYQGVLTETEAGHLLDWFHEDIGQGCFKRVSIDFAALFVEALNIAAEHTGETGSRSLDIMHLAAALQCGVKTIVSFDKRQLELSGKLGLKTKTWGGCNENPDTTNSAGLPPTSDNAQ